MRRCIRMFATMAVVACLVVQSPPAHAYYDDVHFALTYYIARQTGFTPQQSFRIASACVSVDWDEQTEPVQAHGQAYLLADRGEGLIDFAELGIRTAAKFAKGALTGGTLERLDHFMTGKLTIREYRNQVTAARHRFHAFRDELQHEDVIGGGPDGLAAQGDVNRWLAEDGGFFSGAIQNKNVGAYLHAFEDMEPHRGYGTTWGHHTYPPDSFALHLKRGMVVGGTTDWVSHRRFDVETLCQSVNKKLTLFMQRASPHQLWRDYYPNEFGTIVAKLAAINPKPEPMSKDIQRQIFIRKYALAKGIDLNRLDGSLVNFNELAVIANDLGIGIPPADIQKHMDGPNIRLAIEAVNAALTAAGMKDQLPYHHFQYDLDENGQPSPDQLDDWVLVGSLILQTRGFQNVTVSLKTVIRDASGKEKEWPLFGVDPVVLSPGVPHEWKDLPIGDVIAEFRRQDNTILRQRYTLAKRVNQFPSIFVGRVEELAKGQPAAQPAVPSGTVPVVIVVVKRGVAGGYIPGAEVKLEEWKNNAVGKLAGSGSTDGKGRTKAINLPYKFSETKHAQYRVTVSAPGYKTKTEFLPVGWYWNLGASAYHTTEQTFLFSMDAMP